MDSTRMNAAVASLAYFSRKALLLCAMLLLATVVSLPFPLQASAAVAKAAVPSTPSKGNPSTAASAENQEDKQSGEDGQAKGQQEPAAKSVISVPQHLTPSDAQRVFREATDACLQGRMDEGVAAYRQLLAAGFTGADIYFNLGTAMLQQGKLGAAVLYLERARRHDPDDQDVLANLAAAGKMRVDRLKDSPEAEEVKGGGSIASQVAGETRGDVWAIVFLSLWLLGWGVLLVRKLASSESNALLAAGVTLVIASLLPAGVVASHLWSASHGQDAVVVSATLPVRDGPDKSYAPSFEVHEGLKVVISDQESGFLHVRLDNGLSGWVPASGVIRIDGNVPAP